MTNITKLLEYLQKIQDTSYIVNLMHWEMDTQAPKKSLDYLIDVKTKVELEIFNLATSEEYKRLIDNVINSEEYNQLSKEEQIYLKELQENYEKDKRVPSEFYEEFSMLCSKSNAIWVEAKEKKDYQIFKPYLAQMIDYTKKYYSYKYPNTQNLYDEMLNDFERGLTTVKIDPLFARLKEGILPLVKKLPKEQKSTSTREYSKEELLDIAKYLLDYIGFDNERGALGIYPHGYTTKLNNNDIRITFSHNKSIFDHVCTVIHEGGHGIFEQSIGANLAKYPIYDINKYALHESQSRFFENILGRNKNFWVPIYEEIKKKLNIELSLDEFIANLNMAKPSLIRTEADELTYCLHIILRYEIERDLFADKISVEDLPTIWNQKMQEYLGIEVPSDTEGILQDVHWSQGSFGYFPSYLLGSIFDGMLMQTIKEKVGDIDTILKEGKIKEITKFLQSNIHKYGGAYNIEEVCQRVCGRNLNVEPIINYFKEKYVKEQK